MYHLNVKNVFVLLDIFVFQVCRVAYELMQSSPNGNGPSRAHSLDVPFHYAFSMNPSRIAIYNHKPKSKNQWQLHIGTLLTSKDGTDIMRQAVKGKKWNGYLVGVDSSSAEKLEKEYPEYKTVKKVPLF